MVNLFYSLVYTGCRTPFSLNFLNPDFIVILIPFVVFIWLVIYCLFSNCAIAGSFVGKWKLIYITDGVFVYEVQTSFLFLNSNIFAFTVVTFMMSSPSVIHNLKQGMFEVQTSEAKCKMCQHNANLEIAYDSLFYWI